MADIIKDGTVSIYQDVELSLTESLVPPVVHVKQFDRNARKIRCVLYSNGMEFSIPEEAVLSYSGTRPDGKLFHYSTEATENEQVEVIDNRVVFTITEFMTEVAGRYPMDITLLDEDGDALGSFSLTLYVERAAAGNRKIVAMTYAGVLLAVALGVISCFITDDGNFGVVSNDGLGYTEGSVSTSAERLQGEMVTASIDDNGYLNFETNDQLMLIFRMDSDGRLVVDYGGEG